MKQFVIENWYYLILCLIGLINMIVLLCKKNKIVQEDTLFEQLLRRLPTMIRTVEAKTGLTGTEKKSTVLAFAISWLSELGVKDALKYSDRISESIEDILSTPQKKGVE